MNIQDNDFELFGLVPRFAQHPSELEGRWKDLQAQVHPDRFVAQGASAQRLAMQWSVRVNEAHKRLRDPLRRAAYLCELKGAPIGAHDNTAMPAEFLLQQMNWREALDEAQARADVEALIAEVRKVRSQALARCEELLDVEDNASAAAQQVRRLMFLDRLLQEAGDRMDALKA
jgi:molecular chaperone HscB